MRTVTTGAGAATGARKPMGNRVARLLPKIIHKPPISTHPKQPNANHTLEDFKKTFKGLKSDTLSHLKTVSLFLVADYDVAKTRNLAVSLFTRLQLDF